MSGISPISVEDMRSIVGRYEEEQDRYSMTASGILRHRLISAPAYFRGKTVALPYPCFTWVCFLTQLLVRRRRLDRGCGRGDGRMLSAGILIIIPVAVIITGVSAAIPIITAAGIITA